MRKKSQHQNKGKNALIVVYYIVLSMFILHSRESKWCCYVSDETSALAWDLPFLRGLGHLLSA